MLLTPVASCYLSTDLKIRREVMGEARLMLPVEFQESYLNYLSYPRNLIVNGTKTYRSTLESYTDRLDDLEADLCLEDEKDVDVPIRDLRGGPGNGIKALVEIVFSVMNS